MNPTRREALATGAAVVAAVAIEAVPIEAAPAVAPIPRERLELLPDEPWVVQWIDVPGKGQMGFAPGHLWLGPNRSTVVPYVNTTDCFNWSPNKRRDPSGRPFDHSCLGRDLYDRLTGFTEIVHAGTEHEGKGYPTMRAAMAALKKALKE